VSSQIRIANRLLVVGNKVRVPQFEPLSEQTTNSLSVAFYGVNSYISLDKALLLIPGSKVVLAHNGGPTAGSFGHDKYFELPDGPPPDGNACPENNIIDYYKILQDSARYATTCNETEDLSSICNFGLSESYDNFCDGLS
jgi:hypothetical protein